MKSWFLLFACNLMWALQFTCIKLVQDQVGPLFTVWAPMGIAAVLLYPVVRREGGGVRLSRQDIVPIVLLAALGVLPAQLLYTWGTQRSLASNAALLTLTLPVFTAILAVLILGERMTWLRWVSFAAAILGVLACSMADLRHLSLGGGYLFGNLLILGGVLGSAFYNSFGKKILERMSPMRLLFYTYVVTLLLMAPAVWALEPESFHNISRFTARTWTGMGLLTVFHNYLSMVLFLTALKQLDAIQTALCNYLITAFGVPVAAIVLGERLGAAAWLGGALVLISTLVVTVVEERMKRRELAPAGS
ncbi:MAG: DMT family transporter [Bryobacterales bacterium]|nr:DMT family transporter [Bryobacterales bacterium]